MIDSTTKLVSVSFLLQMGKERVWSLMTEEERIVVERLRLYVFLRVWKDPVQSQHVFVFHRHKLNQLP